jgi:hypothetical protein
MDKFTTSTILNVPSGRDSARTTNTKAVKILSSRTDIGKPPNIRCPYYKSQVIAGTLNSIDPDRIRNEENYVIEIQKILEYYNKNELAGLQEELNIP